jgi:hypothetical protein
VKERLDVLAKGVDGPMPPPTPLEGQGKNISQCHSGKNVKRKKLCNKKGESGKMKGKYVKMSK